MAITTEFFSIRYSVDDRHYSKENIPLDSIRSKIKKYDKYGSLNELKIDINQEELIRQREIGEWNMVKFKEVVCVLPKPNYVRYH